LIQNIKDLEKLIKLLRRQGVQDFKMGDIALKLGDLPIERQSIQVEDEIQDDPYANFPTGMLTEAQAMHYAMGGVPENDPELIGKQ
jgi:hypothetical protein